MTELSKITIIKEIVYMYGLLTRLQMIPNMMHIRQKMRVIRDESVSWNSTILIGSSNTSLPAIRENKTAVMDMWFSLAFCAENHANSK